MDTLTTLESPVALELPTSEGALGAANSHVPRLLRVARSILGCEDLAWDAVQDALMCLWHEREAPPDLGGWLVRTTVHRSLHHARCRERRRRHEDLAWRDRAGECEPDPLQGVISTELARLIRREIAALPSPFREPFALRELSGLDYSEIAERLELAPGTVRSRIHRAKALLRGRLATLVHDPDHCGHCLADGGPSGLPASRD